MRIVTLSGSAGGFHVDDLRRAAEQLGHEFSACQWNHLQAQLGGDHDESLSAKSETLDQVDAVIVRTMPPGSLEQVVFRMDLLHALVRRGVKVVNPPRAIEMAVDKYLSLSVMGHAGLPVPETVACHQLADAMAGFERLGGDVICKPLFGSEGLGMCRLTDASLAERAFVMLQRAGSVIYLQKFVEHGGRDYRLLVLGDQVIAAMTRTSDGWKTNIAKGGTGRAIQPEASMIELALHAARACGCDIAGVDLAVDSSGRTIVFEVNAVPGWRALASVCDTDVAMKLVEHLQTLVGEARHGR